MDLDQVREHLAPIIVQDVHDLRLGDREQSADHLGARRRRGGVLRISPRTADPRRCHLDARTLQLVRGVLQPIGAILTKYTTSSLPHGAIQLPHDDLHASAIGQVADHRARRRRGGVLRISPRTADPRRGPCLRQDALPIAFEHATIQLESPSVHRGEFERPLHT